jgi:hypothetical protein
MYSRIVRDGSAEPFSAPQEGFDLGFLDEFIHSLTPQRDLQREARGHRKKFRGLCPSSMVQAAREGLNPLILGLAHDQKERRRGPTAVNKMRTQKRKKKRLARSQKKIMPNRKEKAAIAFATGECLSRVHDHSRPWTRDDPHPRWSKKRLHRLCRNVTSPSALLKMAGTTRQLRNRVPREVSMELTNIAAECTLLRELYLSRIACADVTRGATDTDFWRETPRSAREFPLVGLLVTVYHVRRQHGQSNEGALRSATIKARSWKGCIILAETPDGVVVAVPRAQAGQRDKPSDRRAPNTPPPLGSPLNIHTFDKVARVAKWFHGSYGTFAQLDQHDVVRHLSEFFFATVFDTCVL